VVVDLSAVYFSILRDRLYTFPKSSRERKSAQTAIWRIGEALARLVAPMLSFTADEVWRYLPKMLSRPESVHLAMFPNTHDITGEVRDTSKTGTIEADWDQLFKLREDVLKSLEVLRQNKTINDSLEAHISLTAGGANYDLLERYAKHLPALFVVSTVELKRGEGEAVVAEASRAAGQKCERCWNYSVHVGEDPKYPTVCERCSAALKVIEGEQSTGAQA